jgi:hypothetical protein
LTTSTPLLWRPATRPSSSGHMAEAMADESECVFQGVMQSALWRGGEADARLGRPVEHACASSLAAPSLLLWQLAASASLHLR